MFWIVDHPVVVLLAGLIVLSVVGFLWFNRSSLASETAAMGWLKNGAVVVDVRTESEFAQKHVTGAVNVPLGQVRESISKQIPNKNQVILLHCAAGGRSAIARRILRQNGYPNSHNLGSYARAERIVKAANEPDSEAPTTAEANQATTTQVPEKGA